jgi:hypothetical protein
MHAPTKAIIANIAYQTFLSFNVPAALPVFTELPSTLLGIEVGELAGYRGSKKMEFE